LVTTGCATTPFVKNGFSGGLQTNVNNPNTLDLSLYPNPTSNVIHMKLINSSNGIAELKIMDLEGRVIKTYQTRSTEIETFGNDLKPGVYFIKVTQGTQSVNKRFVKM
jgi:hypothetical protein